MNKEYIEAKVVSLTRKIHPQDLGEETSKLENILRQALEEVVAEERESVRAVIEKLIEGNDAGLWGCRESFGKLLASLQDKLTVKK